MADGPPSCRINSVSDMETLHTMFNTTSTACFNSVFKNASMHPTSKRLFDAIRIVTDGKLEPAKALGQSSATITNWKARGVSKEGRLLALAQYSISPRWVESGDGPMLTIHASMTGESQSIDLSNNPVLSDAPAGEKKLVNSVVVNNNTWKNWQWENVLTWQHTFARRHDLVLTGGISALENHHEYNGGANTNLPSNNPKDAYISNTIDPIASQSAYGGADESALQSFFGRANYEFDGKYLVSAAFRADGSSRFGANNR